MSRAILIVAGVAFLTCMVFGVNAFLSARQGVAICRETGDWFNKGDLYTWLP